MSIGDTLMQGLGAASYALDTPGALLRGLLAGKPGERVAGRDLLEQYGLVGANTDQGWIPDAGDLAGFAADTLLDPLNLIGGGLVKTAAGKAAKIKAANKLSQKMRAAGALPEEAIQHMHPSMLEAPGVPKKFFHGTNRSGLEVTDLDPKYAGSALDTGSQGKGVYFTDKPDWASDHTEMLGGKQGAVLSGYLNSRDPFVMQPGSFERQVAGRVPGTSVESLVDDAVGPGRATEALRSVGHDATVHPSGITAMFDKSQIHSPHIAPAMQDVPKSVRRRLEAIAAYNAMARSGGLIQQ